MLYFSRLIKRIKQNRKYIDTHYNLIFKLIKTQVANFNTSCKSKRDLMTDTGHRRRTGLHPHVVQWFTISTSTGVLFRECAVLRVGQRMHAGCAATIYLCTFRHMEPSQSVGPAKNTFTFPGTHSLQQNKNSTSPTLLLATNYF